MSHLTVYTLRKVDQKVASKTVYTFTLTGFLQSETGIVATLVPWHADFVGDRAAGTYVVTSFDFAEVAQRTSAS